jgi:hypothetical protein
MFCSKSWVEGLKRGFLHPSLGCGKFGHNLGFRVKE